MKLLYKSYFKTFGKNRPKIVLPKIIYPLQGLLLQGKDIHINILVVKEFLKKPFKRGLMIRNAKNYDRLACKFIQKCFTDLGFSEKSSNWIMKCITTTSILVLLHGIPAEPFSQTKELKMAFHILVYFNNLS